MKNILDQNKNKNGELLIEFVKLETGEWFYMPEGYDWYRERYFVTIIPEPKTFEEFKDKLYYYYEFPKSDLFKVVYYDYWNFAVIKKQEENNNGEGISNRNTE